MSQRLRPTRAGIINLWDYTNEVFAFAGGRLVLRGSNGSGKTKALEVLFPFVLDGRLDARRLDPFSGEDRTMKENLLWRGDVNALGYSWMEFGDGERFVTVGVGLRARRDQATPGSWFFVADGRVGEEIHLVEPDGRPRTKGQLTDALGDGAVVERAGEHRRRVDEVLFGLGGERYEAMLDLVLTLRRPMLAKDLDPKSLSSTLTRGLRPLDEALVEQVARSFDDLEAVQRDLDRLAAADEVAQRFLVDYRGYLRTQARFRADAAIEAAAADAAAAARLAAANAGLDEARAGEALAEAEAVSARDALTVARARLDGLKASDAFRSAGQLEHLERAVADLARSVDRAEGAARAAAEAHRKADTAYAEAKAAHRAAAGEVDRSKPKVSVSALAAGISWDATDGDAAAGEVEVKVAGRTAARQADLAAVRAQLEAVDDAARRAEAADVAVGTAEQAVERATAAVAEAEAAVGAARRALAEAVERWADTHPSVVDADDRAAMGAAVIELGDDASPSLRERWSDLLAGRRASATAERATLAARSGTLAEQTEGLRARRQTILDEHDDAPPPVPWRGYGREARDGAPLWRLVRFRDDLDDATASGIEAALEASGLLDAWVRPDGSTDGDALDGFLTAAPGSATGGATTLAAVLEPEDHAVVRAAVVAAVLASVPLDHGGPVSVGADGRYRLGPLTGRHEVAAPRFIGATARARHRAARVAALDAELAELAKEATAVSDALAGVEAWLAAADAATASLPPPKPLFESVRARDRASGQLSQARTTLDTARATLDAARRVLTDRQQALLREAQSRAVPASREGLDDVAAATERFGTDGAALARDLERVVERARYLADSEVRRTEALAEVERTTTALADRRREHQARTAELETLRDGVGADVAAVLDDVAATEAAIADGEDGERQLLEAARVAAAARGSAEGEVRASADAVGAAQAAAADAGRRLGVLRRPDLAGPLGLETAELDDTSLLATVDALAVGVSAAEERRKAARTTVQRGLEGLEHALGAGYRAAWDVEDDVIVVTVSDDLGVRSVGDFAAALASQRAEQEALLTARERAVFEDTLLMSVCGQIHARIAGTRELVAAMDAEMRARRLSSGQTVGVSWRAVDGATPEWRAVHRLLDGDPAHFGPDQLDTLRRHFSAEIKIARATEHQAPYRELLARVLDYRSWRQFELTLVEADGSEAALTKARHARLSGGEKAASLHLPLFAAAHAAFAGASDDCPRLLALDEAFAGIDDQGRSELLSLSVAFDLDLFMTGFDLWATHRSVPAVAHYDLLHLADDHAVSSLLVLWNGSELVEGPDADAQLAMLA